MEAGYSGTEKGNVYVGGGPRDGAMVGLGLGAEG